MVPADRGPVCPASYHRLYHAIFYLLTALDPVVAERMAGDVALAPEEGKYAYLKGKLMEVYGLTGSLTSVVLGIGNPPNSAHICRALLSTRMSFDKKFLRQLPEDVRVQVASLEAVNLPALAHKADIIMAAKQASSSVCVSSRPPISIDRLKPAHLDRQQDRSSSPAPALQAALPLSVAAPPTHTTSSGRHVHWPRRLRDFVP